MIKNTVINYIRLKIATCQDLLCAVFVTSIFSLRWRNCLPFSGYMPVLKGGDNLEIWSRYLFYAREPFGSPIGLIKGLGFPFHTVSISRGPIELFAILFKFLSKIYAPFSEFYYPVLFELVCVFLVAYFTCLILKALRVRSFWVRLLGTVLASLSFPLLFRSSSFYGLSYQVAYFPIYMAFFYFLIRLYNHPDRRSFFLLMLFFLILAFFNDYGLFGTYFIFFIFLILIFFRFILNRNRSKADRDRLFFAVPALILGVIITFFVSFMLGNQENMTVSQDSTLLSTRYDTSWGYGGGYGGGFHVADVLSVVIPPKNKEGIPLYKTCGPTSYLSRIGFPITTNDLQDGQYEGFTYLGTVTILILLFLVLSKILSLIGNYRKLFAKLRLQIMSKFFMVNEIFSLPVIIGISVTILYIFSWGYIIHIGGVRLNDIATPSLILAEIWPRFMLIRSLGRLAIPFMLYIIIVTVVWLDRYLYPYLHNKVIYKRIPFVSIIIFLMIAHTAEVWGYLKPPQVTYGNAIANALSREDKILIKRLLEDKKALMVVPKIRDNFEWGKICYSLAFYANIPLSSAVWETGISPKYKKQYDEDIKQLLEGNVKDIVHRYGEVAIAAPPNIANEILAKCNVPLRSYKLRDQDVTVLILDMQHKMRR